MCANSTQVMIGQTAQAMLLEVQSQLRKKFMEVTH